MATFLLWADLFRSSAFSGFQGHDWPAAFRAGFLDWRIPCGIFAIRVGIAGVKHFSVAALALDQAALIAFGASDTRILGLFQWLNVFTFRIR